MICAQLQVKGSEPLSSANGAINSRTWRSYNGLNAVSLCGNKAVERNLIYPLHNLITTDVTIALAVNTGAVLSFKCDLTISTVTVFTMLGARGH